MKIYISTIITIVALISLSFCCLGEDYGSSRRRYFSKEKKETDFYSEDEESETDYMLEDFSLRSEEGDYSGEGDSFVDIYMDPSLGGYGYLSGQYEYTEYGQPTEDFYYYRDPEIPMPPTLTNILYQEIIRRHHDK